MPACMHACICGQVAYHDTPPFLFPLSLSLLDTAQINHNITSTVPTNPCTNDSSNATVPAATLCSVHGVGFLPNECTESCAAYSGSICTAVLRAWASCANGNELRISPGLDQASLESNMVLLNQFLGEQEESVIYNFM